MHVCMYVCMYVCKDIYLLLVRIEEGMYSDNGKILASTLNRSIL